jgi:leucyl-tRNA synthetase
MTNQPYKFTAVEQKWRPYWQKINLYQTGSDPDKPNYAILDFFPYPSGEGLSVGHCRNYVPTCITARYQRMKGYNVLHPMGWDAFGLPAENYAIQHHIHPQESTRIFTDTYRRQMQLVELSYDWSREINSTDPDYYRWTQYFFLLLHEQGLAYRAPGRQWWCPTCQTILANEQVEHGRCWRCDTEVTTKDLEQWFFKITAYADRLLADLDTVDWPENIKTMQRNWIGRSEGAEVVFPVQAANDAITAFTTRPDTLFGVTFIALAPEHPLAEQIAAPEQRTAVTAYSQQAARQSEIERTAVNRPKTGIFTGAYARHPLTGADVPIWVADFVLAGVGSGAVMGVPAHDVRDFAFARQYGLPIVEVVSPDGTEHGVETCFSGSGSLIHSGEFDGLASAEGAVRITAVLQAKGMGQPQVTYKMRDWLISRQRYWGAPIPVIHCETCGIVPVPQADLPVLLPETDDFAPAGDVRSPLSRIEEWVNVPCPQCSQPARRETDTMDGFVCSSWYFLRYASPHEAARPFDPEAVRRWLPVDTYVGGAEHAVMHLLYARFFTKVLYDAGFVPFQEPFSQLRNQGMLLSAEDGRRMSKSRGNVITPDEVIAKYGVDALRLHLVFLGPFDMDALWDERGIRGITRFIERYWRLAQHTPPPPGSADADFERERHKIIKRVTADVAQFRFNTAVAALMEYLNYLTARRDTAVSGEQWRQAIETFTLLLAPFAPFVTEEVWQTVLGYGDSVHRQSWPVYDAALAADAQITIVIQVNGKLRDRITASPGLDETALQQMALASDSGRRYVNGRDIQKIIVIPDKLVNIVV